MRTRCRCGFPPWFGAEQGAGRIVLLLLVLLAGVGFFLYQRSQAPQTSAPPETSQTPRPARPAPTNQPAKEPLVATDRAFTEAAGRMVSGVPDVPAYPGATLVGSAEQARAAEAPEGYRIKWTTSASVSTVMQWYAKALPAAGWSYQPPDDAGSPGEQLARIRKDRLDGYVAAEATGGVTEIVVSLQDTRRANKRGQR
jgi:hypothetical protein